MKKYLIPGLIILLFLVTRLYKISQIPSSVYWDEASIGYNALAIATDMKDEWGDTLPLHFRAFGEFKLPVYIYSVALLTKFFGSNEITLRLPSVLYSLGTIIAVYFLAKKITKKESVGLASAFLLTISPWLFIFSRTGFEATAGLFFFFMFLIFLLLYQEKRYYIILASISAILSIYSYNSFRIIIPLIMVIWAITQKHRDIKLEMTALGLFLISLIPIVRLYMLDAGAVRLVTVGANGFVGIISNYISHFDPKFLFVNGDVIKRHGIPGWGELYWLDLPIFLIGIWKILKERSKLTLFFILLLVLSPMPAAITRESPHALRAILMAPSIALVSAMGLISLKKYVLYIVVAIYLVFFGFYFRDFITKYNTKTLSDWQYEYKQIFLTTNSGLVTDKYAQPYIFALYYLKYPPEKFREEVKLNQVSEWGFSKVASFNGFQFKP